VFLVPLLLLMTTAGSAEAAKLMWQAPFEGAFTPDQGFSLSQGAFVPLDQSDVVMQDRFLVALHGAGIQEVTTDFASLTQTPSDLFFATAMISPGTAYLIKATDGTYTKLCTCGTYTTGTGGADYYAQYNVTVAQSASPQTAPAPPPPPAPAPTPTAAPATLTVDGSSGKVLLTWTPMDSPNDGYVIYRAKAPGAYDQPLDYPTRVWTYTDHAVTPGQTYYYVVAARRNGSDTVRTNEVSVTVTPEKTKRSIWLMVGRAVATVNGVTSPLDVAPQIIDGRTMVPLRFVSTALGADLKWDPADGKITVALGTQTVVLWVDKPTAYVNGNAVDLDVPPTIVDDRTLVPLRFIATSLGADLVWNGELQTILLSMDPDVQSVTTTAWTSPEQQAKTLDPVLWRLFRLRLPTDAYTDPKGALYSEPGAITNSLLQLYADGTYTWESAADNRHIAGFWTATDGDVILLDGEGGQDWTISPDHGSGQGDITVYSDHARYVGDVVE
jgi:hypothetical protein